MVIALSLVWAGCTSSGEGSKSPVTVVGTTERPDRTMVPGNQKFQSGKMITPKTYQTQSIDPKMAQVNGERSAIVFSEISEKKITTHDAIGVTVIDNKVTESPSKNTVVTTTRDADFQGLNPDYQNDRKDPLKPADSDVDAGRDAVSLDEINRYSDSAEIVDQDGIPVEKAIGTETKQNPDSVIRD